MSIDDTTLAAAGVGDTGPVFNAVADRANIFQMTAAAETAVLRPRDCGRWSHALRAALAARIANLNDAAELARHHLADAGEFAALADPGADGAQHRLGLVVAFMDKVAAHTRDIAADDIAALQDAGVTDADIVRLCELNAFLAYQIRVVSGLQLMTGGQP